MRLTSYRAAPPRVGWVGGLLAAGGVVPPELRWGGSAGPGGDLLCHALRRSTIGAEGFHGRVRDGIGCLAPRYGHQAVQALPDDGPSPRMGGPCRSELCDVSRRNSGSACPGGTLVPPREGFAALPVPGFRCDFVAPVA